MPAIAAAASPLGVAAKTALTQEHNCSPCLVRERRATTFPVLGTSPPNAGWERMPAASHAVAHGMGELTTVVGVRDPPPLQGREIRRRCPLTRFATAACG
jgi:hypothetical protein